jgi:hypothetical protein
MFNIGDIVRWAWPDVDDVGSYGIVTGKKGLVYTVTWFDDYSENDYAISDLVKP